MKSTSPIGIDENNASNKGLVALLLISVISCLIIFSCFLSAWSLDPYTKASMKLSGSKEKGGQLFRINCVGCHGITAQGLVGPDLHGVTADLSDKKIINQVTRGLTPPMPSFEMDSQSMADLLSYLHSLN